MKEKKEQSKRSLTALDDEELCRAFKKLERRKDEEPGGLNGEEHKRHQSLAEELQSRNIPIMTLGKEAYAESMNETVEGYPVELDEDIEEKETDELTDSYKQYHKQTIQLGSAYNIFDAEELTRFDAIRRELRRRRVSVEELEQKAYQEFMQE